MYLIYLCISYKVTNLSVTPTYKCCLNMDRATMITAYMYHKTYEIYCDGTEPPSTHQICITCILKSNQSFFENYKGCRPFILFKDWPSYALIKCICSFDIHPLGLPYGICILLSE